MKLIGTVHGKGLAQQEGCLPLPYELITPTNAPSNLVQLAKEIARWQQEVDIYQLLVKDGKLTIDVQKRAQFGVDVLKNVESNLKIGVCCQILAADADGSILGAIIYNIVPPHEGSIGLLVVDPLHLAGVPYKPQLRGVGTSLVAAASRRMLEAGVDTVFLHPLDKEAERFWRGRGFITCGLGSLLCIRGRPAIEQLIGHCVATPEQASRNEIILCGLPATVRSRLLASFPQPQLH